MPLIEFLTCGTKYNAKYKSFIVVVLQEDFSNYEANDPWVQAFIYNLDSLLVMFKVCISATLNILFETVIFDQWQIGL